MKKKMYFYFYVSSDFSNNIAVKVHEICLKKYIQLFDEIYFIAAVDDQLLPYFVNKARNWCDKICQGKEYNLRIVDNAKIRESRVILEDIFPSILKGDNDMVFVGHSKGIVDVNIPSRSIISVLRWVISMYYYCFEYVNEAEDYFKSGKGIYGSLMTRFLDKENHQLAYIGNFYWLLPKNLKNGMIYGNTIPESYVDRFLAETFPYLVNIDKISARNNRWVASEAFDLYHLSDEKWPEYLSLFGDQDELFAFQTSVILQAASIILQPKKYSVLTYNIGGHEKIHEIENPSDDCEYVYVTDDKSVTSKTWNVIYVENDHPEDNFYLCSKIRYNPFDYVSTDVVIRVDGRIIPSGDIDEIYETFVNGEYDIGLFVHPERYNFEEEIKVWEDIRGYNEKQAEKQIDFFRKNGYDISNYKGLFQTGIIIHKKTELNSDICNKTFSIIKELAEDGKLVERLDQIVFSFVINHYHSEIKVLPLGDNLLQDCAYFKMYWHDSDKLVPIRVSKNKKYMFNKEVIPYNFKDCKDNVLYE